LSANADTMKANELAANQGGSQRAHARGHHGKTSAGDSEE
jgi:hypothetical protein